MRNLSTQGKHSRSWWSKNSRLQVKGPQIRGRTTRPAGGDSESWKLDEHWVAITAYLAEMDFPNEG